MMLSLATYHLWALPQVRNAAVADKERGRVVKSAWGRAVDS